MLFHLAFFVAAFISQTTTCNAFVTGKWKNGSNNPILKSSKTGNINGLPFPILKRTYQLHNSFPYGDDDYDEKVDSYVNDKEKDARRQFLKRFSSLVTAATFTTWNPSTNMPAYASDSTETAEITDRIYIEFQGLPTDIDSNTDSASTFVNTNKNRIVIGLFGKDAPQPVSILKQLVSSNKGGSNQGYQAPCQPKAIRTLQREQLEANKVYKACKENEEAGLGVTYDLSTVWRIDKDRRIDVGAVVGKYIARVYPTFTDTSPPSSLRHTSAGTVSVRRGNESGFGFTISPSNKNNSILDEDNIVVGRIVEGMEVVERLNTIPVVQSSNINYMSLTGGSKGQNAPDRSCRYGGPMYCNELKPLKKITIIRCGIL